MTDEKLISNPTKVLCCKCQKQIICITLLLKFHVRQWCNTFSALKELLIIEGGKREMLVPCGLFYVYSLLSNIKFAGVPTAKLKQRSDAYNIIAQYLQHKIKTKCKLHCKKISYYIWLVYTHTSLETGRQYRPFPAPKVQEIDLDSHHPRIFGCE